MNNNSNSLYLRSVYVQDIDTSNTIDGAPIYYWIKEHDKIVPLDAGFVTLMNCTQIQVQNLKLSDGQGIILVDTGNSSIANNIVITNHGGGAGIGLTRCSNNTITGNRISGHPAGIELHASSNNTIIGNEVFYNDRGICPVSSSKYNVISRNNITRNDYGIDDDSGDNTFSENSITYHTIGISIRSSRNLVSENTIVENAHFGIIIEGVAGASNTIIGNNITNNGNDGISIRCSGNVLRNNRIGNSSHSLNVVTGFDNDVDASNTVDGKPIYYWVNQQGGTVPSDAGYVILVNCKNIMIQGLALTGRGDGIMLVRTTDSIVTRNVITGKTYGITFYGSAHNRVVGNTIANCQQGIRFDGASWYSSHEPSPNNLICYNNFVNNQKTVYDIAANGGTWPWYESATVAVNIWDYGYPSGGNYWSDYTGTDANGDGIGDIPYVINSNNKDRYPLMNQVAISAVVVPPFPDLTPPTVTINSPVNKTYATSDVPLTLNVNEDTAWKAYSLDGEANVTIAENTALTGLTDGKHTVIAYAKDQSGNVGSSSKVYFTVDTVPPEIEILSIKNETINTKDVPLNFTISETVLWIAYSLDSQENVTIYGNLTLTGLSEGSHTVTVYARDWAGNVGFKTIHFTIASESQSSGLPLEYGYAIVSVIAVAIAAPTGYFVLKRKRNGVKGK